MYFNVLCFTARWTQSRAARAQRGHRRGEIGNAAPAQARGPRAGGAARGLVGKGSRSLRPDGSHSRRRASRSSCATRWPAAATSGSCVTFRKTKRQGSPGARLSAGRSAPEGCRTIDQTRRARQRGRLPRRLRAAARVNFPRCQDGRVWHGNIVPGVLVAFGGERGKEGHFDARLCPGVCVVVDGDEARQRGG